MNLHAMAAGLISQVNPMLPATVHISSGYTTAPNGEQVPSYLQPPLTVQAQVQALTFRDIQQIDGLNLQGVRYAIYLYGKIDGLVRSERKGGDLIDIATGTQAGKYLVAMVLEQWPDWCKVAATLQNS